MLNEIFPALIVSVATSNILREGRISGAERLNDPEISKCLDKKNCPVTMDFRPTCASDGKTYVNHAIIRCLNECLKADERELTS